MNSFHAQGAIDYGQSICEVDSTYFPLILRRHERCWRDKPEEGRRDTSREASLCFGSRSCKSDGSKRISHLRTVRIRSQGEAWHKS